MLYAPVRLRAIIMEVKPDPEGLERLIVTAPEFDAEFEVSGQCPVQGSGTVLGRALYFRARHDKWSFDVADYAGRMSSDGYRDSDGFYREGDYPNASWMSHAKAVRIITACLEEFTEKT